MITRKYNEMYVIGIDHGYGNMKTANCAYIGAVATLARSFSDTFTV